MTFTGSLGTSDSALGNIVLGYGSQLAQPPSTSSPGDATVSASKFYFQNVIHPNAIYPANGELCSTLPVSNFHGSSGDAYESLYLSPLKGTAQTAVTLTTTGTTSRQDLYFARFISDFLQPQTIGVVTPSVGCAAFEDNAAMNSFLQICIYLWRPKDQTVAATLIDRNDTAFGSQFNASSETGIVSSVGISTTSVDAQAGDVLVVELWTKVNQGNIGVHNATVYYGGTTDLTDGVGTSDSASYIDLVNPIYFGNSAAVAFGVGQGGTF